jgi:hypothetical protein
MKDSEKGGLAELIQYEGLLMAFWPYQKEYSDQTWLLSLCEDVVRSLCQSSVKKEKVNAPAEYPNRLPPEPIEHVVSHPGRQCARALQAVKADIHPAYRREGSFGR